MDSPDLSRKTVIASVFFFNRADANDSFIHTIFLSCFADSDLGDRGFADEALAAIIQNLEANGRPVGDYHVGHVGLRELFAHELAEAATTARNEVPK